MNRAELLAAVARRLTAVERDHPLRVGIDGPCGAGKSTLAVELTGAIAACGRPALHVSSDGFHNRRDIRYRQGRNCARGYYEDAYDFEALVDRVLVPLGPGGSRVYASKVHDLATDRTEHDRVATAPVDAIVLFDCTFLQRGSLREMWDEVIYLHVRREVAVARGAARDAAALGGIADARRAYDERYMAACDIYLREERPQARASIVVDCDDVERPHIVRGLAATP